MNENAPAAQVWVKDGAGLVTSSAVTSPLRVTIFPDWQDPESSNELSLFMTLLVAGEVKTGVGGMVVSRVHCTGTLEDEFPAKSTCQNVHEYTASAVAARLIENEPSDWQFEVPDEYPCHETIDPDSQIPETTIDVALLVSDPPDG